MKLRMLCVLSGLVAATQAVVAAGPREDAVIGESRINVQFVEPENFTDIRDSWTDTSDSQREWVLAEFRKFLQSRGEQMLREDLHLTVWVKDIDLAGDFEPWHFRTYQDIRVVKDIYPVRIRLEFQLTDSTGTVLAQGERRLNDMGRVGIFIPDSDLLRYEKEVLRDWLAREFRRYRKT